MDTRKPPVHSHLRIGVVDDRIAEAGDHRVLAGDRIPEAGDHRVLAGGRIPEAGNHCVLAGDRIPVIEHCPPVIDGRGGVLQ